MTDDHPAYPYARPDAPADAPTGAAPADAPAGVMRADASVEASRVDVPAGYAPADDTAGFAHPDVPAGAAQSDALAGAAPTDDSAEVVRAELRDNPDDSIEARIRMAYAYNAEKHKDHLVAGLFAVFLGAFGMHKFYLGYNQAAFTMLAVTIVGSILTLGLAGAVMWVIAIIEGIIYLTRSQAAFDAIYVKGQRAWF